MQKYNIFGCVGATQRVLLAIVHLFVAIRPESKLHGANMGPIWGRQDPGGPHVGPMNFAIWAIYLHVSLADVYVFNCISEKKNMSAF